jgi:hypothetical protein
VGLPNTHGRSSALLWSVGDDAEILANISLSVSSHVRVLRAPASIWSLRSVTNASLTDVLGLISTVRF